MAQQSQSQKVKSERDFIKESFRNGAMITVTAMILCVVASGLTMYRFGSEVYIQAMINGAVLPLFIAPACLYVLSRQGLIGHRQMLEINRLAHTDEMTGLPNRRAFMQEASARIAAVDFEKHGLCILLIDLDHFKNVNDKFGHDVGDKTLIHVAQEISDAAPPESLIARLGGEEFAVLLPFKVLSDLHHYGETIRARVASRPCLHEGAGIQVTISIGAGIAVEADTVSSILTRADCALYEAKGQGRNRFSMAA